MVRPMTSDSDHMIEEEAPDDERRIALAYVTEAYAEAILAGIDGDCFAHAAMFSALQELVATYGEEPVAQFAERLPQRIRDGEFSIAQRH